MESAKPDNILIVDYVKLKGKTYFKNHLIKRFEHLTCGSNLLFMNHNEQAPIAKCLSTVLKINYQATSMNFCVIHNQHKIKTFHCYDKMPCFADIHLLRISIMHKCQGD